MLMQQFEQLNEKTQNALLSLHSEKSESSNLQEKLNDILDCNGIEVVPVNSVALYLTIPRSVDTIHWPSVAPVANISLSYSIGTAVIDALFARPLL